MISVYIDRKKWKQVFNWPMAITLLAAALIVRSLYLSFHGDHYIFLSFSICIILLAIVVQRKIEKRRKVQEIEAIKIFAERKSREASSEIAQAHKKTDYNSRYRRIAKADWFKAAYENKSLGEEPCDPIHNSDE